jgi:PleD family two-component response regulator
VAKHAALTLDYGDEANVALDVAIIGSDATTQELLRELLGQRGYRLFALESVAQVVSLCGQVPVKVVVAMAEPHGFDHAAELHAALGEAAPAVILLSHAAPPPEPRGAVAAVLPKRIDESLRDTIEAVVEPSGD